MNTRVEPIYIYSQATYLRFVFHQGLNCKWINTKSNSGNTVKFPFFTPRVLLKKNWTHKNLLPTPPTQGMQIRAMLESIPTTNKTIF